MFAKADVKVSRLKPLRAILTKILVRRLFKALRIAIRH